MKRINTVVICFIILIIIGLCTNHSMAGYNDGLAHYKAGEFTQAITALQEAVEQNPASLDTRYLLGLTYYKAGKYEESKAQLEQVTVGRPHHGKAHTNLARTLLRLEAYPEAIEAASRGAKLTSDSGAFNTLGRAYQALKKYDEADQAFQTAIEKDPDNPWPYNNRGYLLILKAGNNPMQHATEAHELFKKAIELSPNNAIFLKNMRYSASLLHSK